MTLAQNYNTPIAWTILQHCVEHANHYDTVSNSASDHLSPGRWRRTYGELAFILFWSSRMISFAPIVPVRPPTPKVMLTFPISRVGFSRTGQLRASAFLRLSSTWEQ